MFVSGMRMILYGMILYGMTLDISYFNAVAPVSVTCELCGM
jgi:hypothetical protein